MIYFDHGATSYPKPPEVVRAVERTLRQCASPGRGGYPQAREAERRIFRCRELAGVLFDCQPEQVVFTSGCTHSLNIAIRSLVRPGARVVISGFEHNAVLRPLHALGANITMAGRRLFDWEDTLQSFRAALDRGAEAAVFTHVSNVFGYILPVGELAKACRDRGIPFVLDAAQSAGSLPVSLTGLGADFIAMPGHKGLLGPQGIGLLLCREGGEPLMFGGTGSRSVSREMPPYLPDRLEPGTMNVPGIGGLSAGLARVRRLGLDAIRDRELQCRDLAAAALRRFGIRLWTGPHQGGVLSFLPEMDCQEAAQILAQNGIAVRSGLHCAPLAHESAGTLETGTVRLSFGPDSSPAQVRMFDRILPKLTPARP